MRNRSLALLCSVALLSLLATVAVPTPAVAGTTQRDVVVSCSFPPAAPTPADRTFGVTLTVPNTVASGRAFAAEVRVQLDMVTVPANVPIDEFRIISEWQVSGGASPSGPVTVTTPTRSYVPGDALIYDTVAAPFTATGSTGSTITFELTAVSYELRHAGATFTVGPDCTMRGAPIRFATTAIGGGAPLCFGVPATITGTVGDDTLIGTSGRDVVHAGAGDDVVYGLGGDDLLCGADGGDVLWGGSGNDQLDGGPGSDLLLGGFGTDSCTSGVGISC